MRGTGRGTAVAACVEPLEPRTLLSAALLSAAVSGQWIAVLHAGVDPHGFADELRSSGREILHVYAHAVSAVAFRGEALPNDSRLASLEADVMFETAAQVLPTGVDRIDADWNAVAGIDGFDQRVDVDIAILDTGIDRNHPDLNVYSGRNFTSINTSDWDDRHGHGTHVAGTAAALDNGFGVVGVAPGARLWGVKVLGDDGEGFLSDLIAGIDWVTARAGQIEVANISMSGIGTSSLLHAAIRNSVAAGIVYVVAAGNDAQDVYGADRIYGTADDVLLASYPEVLTVSAFADSDGRQGGLGSSTHSGADDSFASFSNFSTSVVAHNPVVSSGAAIDLMMSGVDILSTYKDRQYAVMSGTSMAAPHAAGLVALDIAQHGRDRNGDGALTAADVYAIRQALIDRAVAQADFRGLAIRNDGDGHREKIGWAGSHTVSPSPAPGENSGAEDVELEQPPLRGRCDDDVHQSAGYHGHFGRRDSDTVVATAVQGSRLTVTSPAAGCGSVDCLSHDGPVPVNRERNSAIPVDEAPCPAAACIGLHHHTRKLSMFVAADAAEPPAGPILDEVFTEEGLADYLLELFPAPVV